MTVIVATDRGIWADSKCCDGESHFPTPKIFRVKGELIGTAGNDQGIYKFMRWYRGPRKKPVETEDGENFGIVVVNKKGIFAYANSSFCNRVLKPWHCVGAGSGYAMAALLAGSSPHRAIEIACEVSPGSCGLPVQHFTLDGNEQYKFDIPNYGRGIAATAS